LPNPRPTRRKRSAARRSPIRSAGPRRPPPKRLPKGRVLLSTLDWPRRCRRGQYSIWPRSASGNNFGNRQP
jgi:hypothetical protein